MLLDTAVAVVDRVTSRVMLNIKCPHNPLVLKAPHLLEINESNEANISFSLIFFTPRPRPQR